ncbi:MAG: adenosylmethionine--8-amino-7-oxononanoate transaminase [Cytophagales bacterium]|nr:MAG: adenosylmethionine--8-amino-7-oxononanoate transaminase [Cytophagales bacterium]
MKDNIIAIDKAHVWHPFDVLHADNICIEKAEGIYLYTSDGRKILDAISSWWVNIHGHANPIISKAIYEQALVLEQVIFAGFTHPPAVNLASKLMEILPFEVDQIFYSDNGSTSVEVAIKLAMQFWYNQSIKRTKIIALEGAYHGDTFGAMAVGERNVFSKPFQPYLFHVEFLPHYTCSEQECIAHFEQLAKTNDIAAFIYEPLVQGAAGMRIYSKELLSKLIAIAKEYQIVCIADEVMTGFGRTGKLFASEYINLPPDIMCVSKGITGGFLPLGVTAVNKKIANVFDSLDKEKRFYHGHSYTANPLSCAAANASIAILTSEECRKAILRIEQSHQSFLSQMLGHPQIKSIQSLGTILSIELNIGNETSYFHNKRDELYRFFMNKNILIRPLGNVIYVLPPYVIKNEELEEIYNAIIELLNLS